MTRNVIWRPLYLTAAAVLLAASAHAAPTVVAPQPIQYTQPIVDGATQLGIIGFKAEVPNPFQPAYTYTPAAAPDVDATVDWYDITMREIVHGNAGLVDNGTAGNPILPGFKAWAYGATAGASTYPGMTISATRGRPVKVIWRNNLPPTHFLPVDPSMMCGPPGFMGPCPDNRTVVHVHGAHGYDHSDGTPEQWFTPPPAGAGPDAYPAQFGTEWAPHDKFGKAGAKVSPYTFSYPVDQEASTIWYHDHATGVTRLNAFAGLAGFFLVHDGNESALQAAGVLPSYPYETGFAFQDKMFWGTPGAGAKPYHVLGAMAYPDAAAGVPAIAPSIPTEQFGNIMLCNGVAWPKMTVEPRKYRIRLLNGGDARALVFQFTTVKAPAPIVDGGDYKGAALPFLVVGNEQGFLNSPVQVTKLPVQPGQRYDIVVDFTGLAPNTAVYMINVGPDVPFNGTFPTLPTDPLYPMADPASSGQLVKFVVGKVLNADTIALGLPAQTNATVTAASVLRDALKGTPSLPAAPAPGSIAAPSKKLYLKEALDANGRLMITLNNKGLFDGIADNMPALGATETWEVANITPDAHPIHVHLVKFRLIDREPISLLNNGTAGSAQTAYPAVLPILPRATAQTWQYTGSGVAAAPTAEESGWIDTFISHPGTLSRIQATFDIPGLYVWHCHILSHEEYDMMREYGVNTAPTGVQLASSSAFQPTSAAPAKVSFFAAGLTGNALYPTSQAYEFRFWLKGPLATDKWVVQQNWSMASNWTWAPPANATGTYYVQVDLRTPGTVPRQFAKVLPYRLGGNPPATTVTLSPTNSSQPAGAAPTPVTFTAAGTSAGVAGTYEYRFWLKDPVTGWAVQQAYSTVPTWTWTPAANTVGAYFVQVDCRATGSTVNADKSVTTGYTVGPTAVALASSAASPQPAATASAGGITFTATPAPAAGSYEYRFWVRSGAGTWQIGQAYSTTSTYTWFPAATPGLYYIEVDIRPAGSKVVRSAAKVIPFQLQ